ncbi:MAG: hypothetical protein WBL88_13625 [Nitrososphaeraceae archaeon]
MVTGETFPDSRSQLTIPKIGGNSFLRTGASPIIIPHAARQ